MKAAGGDQTLLTSSVQSSSETSLLRDGSFDGKELLDTVPKDQRPLA